MKYTWVFLIVLVLLGAAYFLFEKNNVKKPVEENGVLQTLGEYFNVDQTKVDHIQLKNDDTVIDLALTGGEWKITKPISSVADAEKANDLIKSILNNPIVRVMKKEETGDLSEYGLDKSRKLVSITGKGDPLIEFMIGDDSVTGGEFYIKVSTSGEIVLTAIQLKEKLVFTPEYYRAKNPLQFDLKSVTGITFTYPYSRLRLETRGEKKDWYIAEPDVFRAKNASVELLLNQLRRMEIVKFLGKKLTGRESHGLDKSPIKVELALGKERSITVDLGDTDIESNGIYARISEIPNEDVVVEASIQQKLQVKASDFREDSLFQIDPENIKTLDVRERGVENLSIMQDDQNKWKMLSPTTGELNDARLRVFFEKLKALRPKKCFSQDDLAKISENVVGFETYSMKIVIKPGDEGKNLEITIGKEQKRGRGYYVKTSEMDGACIVTSDLIKAFISANTTLKNSQ